MHDYYNIELVLLYGLALLWVLYLSYRHPGHLPDDDNE